jgi:hypothetical protein
MSPETLDFLAHWSPYLAAGCGIFLAAFEIGHWLGYGSGYKRGHMSGYHSAWLEAYDSGRADGIFFTRTWHSQTRGQNGRFGPRK